ncbi:MAG: hypothetical protein MJB14_21355 [Spirochaetes bacterium]|nr:hypothetical protein [Spirochaetota bacterium]
MKKYAFITIVVTFLFQLNAQKFDIFEIQWGLNAEQLQQYLTEKNVEIKEFAYYSIRSGKDQAVDLQTSSFIKYSAESYLLYDHINSLLIFTFYNSNGTLEGLQLSKVEIYLKRKDHNGLPVNIRSIFKNQISVFCEKNDIILKTSEENEIFRQYDYEINLDNIYVSFMANIGDNRLNRNESLYISLENNELQSMLLQKEVSIQSKKDEIINGSEE